MPSRVSIEVRVKVRSDMRLPIRCSDPFRRQGKMMNQTDEVAGQRLARAIEENLSTRTFSRQGDETSSAGYGCVKLWFC